MAIYIKKETSMTDSNILTSIVIEFVGVWYEDLNQTEQNIVDLLISNNYLQVVNGEIVRGKYYL